MFSAKAYREISTRYNIPSRQFIRGNTTGYSNTRNMVVVDLDWLGSACLGKDGSFDSEWPMRNSQFSDERIVAILGESERTSVAEVKSTVASLCRNWGPYT